MKKYIKSFSHVSLEDVAIVGGKNASLGEMINNLKSLGVEVPDGFAITVDAYSEFLSHNGLTSLLQDALNKLDRQALSNLQEIGATCITRFKFKNPK